MRRSVSSQLIQFVAPQQQQMQQSQISPQQQPDAQQFYTSAPVSEPVSTAAMPSSQNTPTITNRTPPNTMSPHNSMPNPTPATVSDLRHALMNNNTSVQRPQPQQHQSSQLSNPGVQPAKPAEPAAAATQSPDTPKRDKERAELIMKINQALLEAANRLQREGKGTDLEELKQKGSDGRIPDSARDFMEYIFLSITPVTLMLTSQIRIMRCMQANLSYLAALMQKGKYQFPGPAIMVCPYKQDPEINKLYAELPKQFGDWKGQMTMKISSTMTSPRQEQQRQQQPHAMNPTHQSSS
jgi:hypothetical protein